jgi:tripartite-type tricarboxylate transporter receptor subunit TctC
MPDHDVTAAPARPGRRAVLGLAGALALPGVARAQGEWPTRSVRIVVPFAPGGTTDVAARLLANALSPRIGRTVLVDNKAGATTMIGAAEVARAEPDGYTFLMAPPPFIIVQYAFPNLPYDTEKDFRPVAMVMTSPFVLVVRSGLEVQSVADLIAMAKARPGVLTYGSPGPGSLPHVATELFLQRTGIQVLHVPYRGGGPAVADLAAGRIDMMLGSPPESAAQVDAGRIRRLAVATLEPSPLVPGLPTMAATVPGLRVEYWAGLLAPARTPDAIVRRMHAETQAVLAMPDIQQRLASLGAAAAPGSIQDFEQLLASERAQFRAAVASAGIVVR